MFCRVGRITDSIPIDKYTGNKRGFSFVCFSIKQDAERDISMMIGRSWGGNRILVNLARPLQDSSPSSNAQSLPAPLSTPRVDCMSPSKHSHISSVEESFLKALLEGVAPSHSPAEEAWTLFNGSVH